MCVSRTVRRRLFYFRIYVQHIPTRVSERTAPKYEIRGTHISGCLVPVPLCKQQLQRRPKKGHPYPKKVILSNVRSIINKIDELQFLLSSSQPDICVFTESWLDTNTPNDSLATPGYSVFRCDRQYRKGGGIMCFIRSHFKCDIIDPSFVSSLSMCKTEFLILYIRDFHLLLICLYHPFWKDSAAHEKAIECISDVTDFGFLRFGTHMRVILCGDFNDLREHFDTISSLCRLTPLVDFPTRGTQCLDQIFTNFACDQTPTFLPPLGRSDHVVIVWQPSSYVHAPAVKIKVRKFSRSNSAKFYAAVSSFDWLALIDDITELDEAADIFCKCLMNLFDAFFPQRTVRIRASEPKWMKVSLKVLIDERDRAYCNKQWAKYFRLREEVISHIRHLKKRYIDEAVALGKNDNIWRSLRAIGHFPKIKKSSTKISVHEFNDYFASNFQSDPISILDSLSDVSDDAPVPVLTVPEVFSFLRRVPNKSCGPDGIPSWVVRDCAHFLCPAITCLFNRSLKEGRVPLCFKMSNIVPVPKRDRPTDVSHFRPISMLPILSKLLEKIVCQKIIFPCVSNKIDLSQFAYIPRPGAGATSALVLAYHKIVEFLDVQSGAVRLLSADFSKAFEKLLHSNIIASCLKFHLPKFVLIWIADFLSFRKQRVCIEGDVSSWCNILSGVPQGSVLGPVLFCIAVDSLFPVCPNTFVVKYADDVTFLHFVRDSWEDQLQDEWDNLVRWSARVKLPLNYDKCAVLDIITKRNLLLSPIHLLNGSTLVNVSSLRFLGVIFCKDMKWNLHVQSIVSKACKRMYIIYNLRRSGCSSDLIFKTYIALIRSVLLFGYPCICNSPNYLLCKLLQVEKRVKKIIGSVENFPSLFEVADKMCDKLMFSILRSSNHPLRVMFRPSHNRSTRDHRSLRPPPAKTSRFSLSFIKFCR